jgi:protein phosphatase
MRVHYSADTNVGLQRQINQDTYGVSDPSQSAQRGTLLIVCDGMGGHTAGEVASRLGVDTILNNYYDSQNTDYPAVLVQAFEQANERIYAQGQGSMGTTGVAALVLGQVLHVANVGDSRAYLVRRGNIHQISQDHSFVSEQVAAGVLTPEQARRSSYRNMITRALGHRPDVQVDIFKDTLQVGDIILLMSDGLHGLVEDTEIAQVVNTMSPDNAVKRLIELANERGGTDNITVVVARVEEPDTASGASGGGVTTQPISQLTRDSASSDAGEAVTRPLEAASHTSHEYSPTEKLFPTANTTPAAASVEEASVVRDQIRSRGGGRRWLFSLLTALAVLVGGGALYVLGANASGQGGILFFQSTSTPTATVTPSVTATPTGSPTLTPRPTRSPTPGASATPTSSPLPSPTAEVAPTSGPTSTASPTGKLEESIREDLAPLANFAIEHYLTSTDASGL